MKRRNIGSRVIAAVDPGVTGAIAFLNYDDLSFVGILDVPVVVVKRKEIQYKLYYDIFCTDPIAHCYIEKVTATATGGISSAFTFGTTFAAPQAFCAALDIPYSLVPPMNWKKHFSLIKKDKDASRSTAVQLYPEAKDLLKFKKDHNRADALLIARYGAEVLRRG